MGAARSLSNHDHLRAKRKGGFSGGWLQNDVAKRLMLQSHMCRRRDVTEIARGGSLTPRTARDSGQHQGKRIAAGRDCQPSNRHTGEFRAGSGGVGQARRRGCVEINHPRNNRHGLVLQPLNSEAAHLQKPREHGRRPCNQPVMHGFDMNAVVSHQTSKDQPATGRGLDQVEREPRLARAGWSTNEESPCANQDRRSMNGRSGGGIHNAYIAGSRTRKRAPRIRSSMLGSVPGSRGATRFCASSRPSWASTICFEIDRPRPEF